MANSLSLSLTHTHSFSTNRSCRRVCPKYNIVSKGNLCMGCPEGPATLNGFIPNGLLPEEAMSVNHVLDQGRWSRVEERTADLIAHIQPNQPSEERRNAIASYVQCLI